MKNKSIYVIIVTYNGIQWIERCLDSVYKSSISAFPIVIDNGSIDGTLTYIRKNYPQCHIIETKENLGFGKANNIGIEYAIKQGAEYVYLLNQDAWVDDDVFEKLLYLMEKYPEYGIISPIQITATRKMLDKNFLFNDLRDDRCPNLKEDLILGKPKEIYELFVVMAAHWMVRLSYLKVIGLFSEAFPHYGEDSNLLQRMHYHKIKVGVCPLVYAVHDRENRIDPPEKQVYRLYIQILIVFHDIYNNNSFTRFKQLLRNLTKIILKRNVSILLKLKHLFLILKVVVTARKYRKTYKIKR